MYASEKVNKYYFGIFDLNLFYPNSSHRFSIRQEENLYFDFYEKLLYRRKVQRLT